MSWFKALFKEKQRKSRLTVITYFVLRVAVVLVLIREVYLQDWNNVFTSILTLVLFMVPSFAERRLKIDLPNAIEITILIFIFAAEVFGEIGEFYINVPIWDALMHTTNGFLMAGIGFALVDVLNSHPRFHFDLSPVFVTFTAFCFSMTIGVLWEFYEYGMDMFFNLDMQKDTIITTISTVMLNPDGSNVPILVTDITGTIIQAGGSEITISGGYLDIGLIDTMKDLLVNMLGAIIFSVFGYLCIRRRNKDVAAAIIPRMLTEEEIEYDNQLAEEHNRARAELWKSFSHHDEDSK